MRAGFLLVVNGLCYGAKGAIPSSVSGLLTPLLHLKGLKAVRYVFLLLLALFIQPSGAAAQDRYQSLQTRQICADTPVLAAVDGDVQWHLPQGSKVWISDFAYGANAQGYFKASYQVGTQGERSTGYVRADEVKHFCDYDARREPSAHRFRAPPNTCHLIGASRRSVEEVNAFVTEHSAFFPTMMVFQSRNGWYAVSLGLIATNAMSRIKSRSLSIPEDAYCSDGAAYVGVLAKEANSFRSLNLPNFPTVEDRLEAAAALMRNARASDDDAGYKRACDMGDTFACGYYASSLKDGPTAELTSELSHIIQRNFYDLLGCMRGDPVTCNNAFITKGESYVGRTLGTAVEWDGDRFWPDLTLELAKVGCDADVKPSCFHLGYKIWDNKRIDTAKWPTAVHALAESCQPGQQWRCRNFRELIEWKDTYMDIPLSQLDRSAIAKKLAWIARADDDSAPSTAPSSDYDTHAMECSAKDGKEGMQACDRAYREYVSHVSADQIDPLVSLLEKNCTPQRPVGCEKLAFLYGDATLSGAEGIIFQGTDQREKRLSALRRGCDATLNRDNTCNALADVLEQNGETQEAGTIHRRGCNHVMRLNADEVGYLQAADCYDAGKFALYKTKNYNEAFPYLRFICEFDDYGTSPYACKHLGRMYENGLGVPADVGQAALYYRNACFHPRVDGTDGEGCLLFGETMINHREALSDIQHDAIMPMMSQDMQQVDLMLFATEMSRAFQRGCNDAIPMACKANSKLFEARVAGDYGFTRKSCIVRAEGGDIASRKTCKAFTHHANPPKHSDLSGHPFVDNVFVWPDGDRTIISQMAGQYALNGKAVKTQFIDELGNACLTNPDTGRSFCSVW